jgi:arylformamidase
MKYYDISLPIEPGMMVYKNKPEKQPVLENQDQRSKGGSFESTITLNLHTGTHLDFPKHMQVNGSTSTNFKPERLITKVRVIDCGQTTVIDAELLKKHHLKPNEFIILKTLSSESNTFLSSFPYVSADGATYCVQSKISGVGIDSLGIERDQAQHETHHLLMDAGIMILEGLRLKGILPGPYQMIALPLSIPNVDALPVRAILVEE